MALSLEALLPILLSAVPCLPARPPAPSSSLQVSGLPAVTHCWHLFSPATRGALSPGASGEQSPAAVRPGYWSPWRLVGTLAELPCDHCPLLALPPRSLRPCQHASGPPFHTAHQWGGALLTPTAPDKHRLGYFNHLRGPGLSSTDLNPLAGAVHLLSQMDAACPSSSIIRASSPFAPSLP